MAKGSLKILIQRIRKPLHTKPLTADLAAQIHIRSCAFNNEFIATMRTGGYIFFSHLLFPLPDTYDMALFKASKQGSEKKSGCQMLSGSAHRSPGVLLDGQVPYFYIL
jgi:hypothetical protein